MEIAIAEEHLLLQEIVSGFGRVLSYNELVVPSVLMVQMNIFELAIFDSEEGSPDN